MKVCVVSTKMPFFDVRVYYKEIISLQKKYSQLTYVCPASADGYLEDMSYAKKERLDANNEKLINGVKAKGVYSPRRNFKFYVLDKLYSKFAVIYGLLFKPVDPYFYAAALAEAADIYQSEEIESYLVCLKVKLTLAKRGKKVQVIFDCQEFWQASKYDDFMHFPVLRDLVRFLTSRVEKYIAQTADYVITCNNIERANFLIHNRFLKTEVIYNAMNAPVKNTITSKLSFAASDLVLVHDGYLYFNRGLKMILDAMLELSKIDKTIKLLLIGNVYDREKAYYEEFMSKHPELKQTVILTGWVDYLEVPQYVALGQVGIITMDPKPMNNMLAGPPNKVFSYIANGVPVLSVDFPEIRGILKEYACGLVFPPGERQLFVKSVLQMRKDPGLVRQMQANTALAYQKYSWTAMEQKLYGVYAEVAESLNTKG